MQSNQLHLLLWMIICTQHRTSNTHTLLVIQHWWSKTQPPPAVRRTVCVEMCAMTSCHSPSLQAVSPPFHTFCLSNVQTQLPSRLTGLPATAERVVIRCLYIINTLKADCKCCRCATRTSHFLSVEPTKCRA